MLNLSTEQVGLLADMRAQAFALRLLKELERQFSELMAPLPAFVRATMVCNGLEKAEAFGFTLAKTMGMFVALQCATAADFFQSERVALWLDARDDDQLARMDRLVNGVPHEVWLDIQRGADLRAWFEPRVAEQQPARLAMQVCTVFPELVRRLPDKALQEFFDAVPARGRRYGIDIDAGLCVFAAALAFYGDTLDRSTGPTWARDIFFSATPSPPARTVALLRHALLADSGRLI